MSLQCPRCRSQQIRKNGHRRGKQNYRCHDCQRQFLASYTQRGYTQESKQICLRMYRLGLTSRQIENFTGICRSTVSHWCRQATLPPQSLAES